MHIFRPALFVFARWAERMRQLCYLSWKVGCSKPGSSILTTSEEESLNSTQQTSYTASWNFGNIYVYINIHVYINPVSMMRHSFFLFMCSV